MVTVLQYPRIVAFRKSAI